MVLLLLAGAGVGWWFGGLGAGGRPGDDTDTGPGSVTVLLRMTLVVVAVVTVLVLGTVLTARRRHPRTGPGAVESAAGAPVLAYLTGPVDPTELPALQPASRAAADLRRLCLILDRAEPGPTVVVVCGLLAGDDAAWVGANLAITLATEGRRTLLVDARIDERYGAPDDRPAGPGLIGVLAGVPLADAVSPGPVPGLEVLPPGRVDERPPIPAPLGDLVGRLAQAARAHDAVIVLGTPLEDRPFVAHLDESGDLVVVLPQVGVRSRWLRERAAAARATGARLLGVVLVSPPAGGA